MTAVEYSKNGDHVQKTVGESTMPSYRPARFVRLSLDDGEIANDGTDTETVTAEIVDGLDVLRGNDPSVLSESGTLTLSIDGAEVSVSIESGIGTTEVTTTKSAGATIEIETIDYDGGPTEPDSATIEVIAA